MWPLVWSRVACKEALCGAVATQLVLGGPVAVATYVVLGDPVATWMVSCGLVNTEVVPGTLVWPGGHTAGLGWPGGHLSGIR